MTPEELENIEGVGPATVEAIQVAVNSYYAQFEDQAGVADGEYAVDQAEDAAGSVAAEEQPAEQPESEPAPEEAAPQTEDSPESSNLLNSGTMKDSD
jgi:hypothetical protein